MKLKIISAFVFLLLLAVSFAAYFGLSSLDKTKNLIQEVGAKALLEQISERNEDQAEFTGKILDTIFSNVETDLLILNQAASNYFENPERYNLKANWNRDEHLIHLENNQLTSKVGDVSSLLSPIQMKITDENLKSISISAMLNNNFEDVFNRNENTVALYFNGKQGYVRYFPSTNLLKLIAPDNDVFSFEIYQNILPENNPTKETLWTSVYEDEVGKGNMITALSPVYAKGQFVGVVGMDITVEKLLTNYIKRNLKKESFVLNSDFVPIIVNSNYQTDLIITLSQKEIEERARLNQKMPKNNAAQLLELQKDFLNKLKELKDPTGYKSIEVNGKLIHISVTKIDKPNWLIVIVLSQEELSQMPDKLNNEMDLIVNELVYKSTILYGVLLLFLVIFISWMISKFLAPILKLTQVTKLIAAGDIEHEIKIEAKNEIKTLVDNFKVMQKAISTQQSSLEDTNEQLQNTVESTSHQLIEQKNLFEGVYNNSSDGLTIMADGVLLDCNDALLQMYNIESKEQFKTMPPGRLSPEYQPDGTDSIEMFQKAVALCLNKGFARHERLVHDTQGVEFWLDVIFIRVEDNEKYGKKVIYSIARLVTD